MWVTQLDAAYEQHYQTKTLNALGTASYGMPLTARVDSLYLGIMESAVKDYGDMALKAGSGVLQGYLYADQTGWTTDAAVLQPWRVTVVATDLTALINTTLVQNLCPPREPSLDGADWIKPGRSTWQWMAVGSPQFADQQQWVDWTQQLGFEYYLVDDGWKAWPDAWNSLKSVVTYATGKGVKVWLWVHSNEITDGTARQSYFKKTADIGVVGVKIDFPPAKDYLANTSVDVLKAIPAVYDESISLPGSEPGKVAAFARRAGRSWFVGILNGANATTLDVPLSFLGGGTWQSIRLGDVTGKADAWDRQEGAVSASDTLKVTLASRGGFVALFRQ